MLVSGGFDPLHIGHKRMIEDAAKFGRVWVALNSDEWLFRKKGYFFMPWEERAEILRGQRGVSNVVKVDDSDGTVCQALRMVRPDYFANGGDRVSPNKAEASICRSHNIEQLFGIGGDKVQSSSALMARLWNRMHA